jgi:site-specific DNA recombinase
MSTPTRTVAYLRVSTDKQADHGVSLDAQRAKVEAYASLYDLELVAVLVDAGASAKTLDRPELVRALAMLDAGEADALLVVKLDRLTRSVADLGTLVDRYFARQEGPALLSVGEQIDTRSAAGRLVLNVLASVAQWEREATGERTAAAMAHKRAQGEYTGGRVPYGWALDDDGVRLVADAGEQSVIRATLELRDSGLSLRKIGAALEARGFLPRNGRGWHAQQIKQTLAAELAA